MSYDNDPLWRLRHALAGMGLALLISVPLAALVGRWVGDALGDSYGVRVAVYAGCLAYVVAGAVTLFIQVARHETRRLTLARLLLWLASLWLWPLLVARRGGKGAPPADGPG